MKFYLEFVYLGYIWIPWRYAYFEVILGVSTYSRPICINFYLEYNTTYYLLKFSIGLTACHSCFWSLSLIHSSHTLLSITFDKASYLWALACARWFQISPLAIPDPISAGSNVSWFTLSTFSHIYFMRWWITFM